MSPYAPDPKSHALALDSEFLITAHDGNDAVDQMYGDTFNGDAGDDSVHTLQGGTCNGGDGIHSIMTRSGGAYTSIELIFRT